MDGPTRLTKLRYPRVLCHRQCSGRDTTGRSGHHGTRFDPRPLSGAACGLYEGIREFGRWPDPFFKTSDDVGAKDLRLSIPRTLLHLTGRTCRLGIDWCVPRKDPRPGPRRIRQSV